MSDTIVRVTCTAPVNIAVLKYWGKESVEFNTPINNSLSVTLSQDQLQTRTTVAAIKGLKEDQLILNGEETPIDNPRIQVCLNEIRKLAQDHKDSQGNVLVAKADWESYKVLICSENNFPTAAGLASSASGYACLVKALAELYAVEEQFLGHLSSIARQGSGSACRSLDDGFVAWEKGNPDGSGSIAVKIAPASHWPDMRVLVLVVNDAKKGVSSTSGMQTSVKTSSLIAHRAEHVVPQRYTEFVDAIKAKDFQKFGELTMKDSNQFHAVCLDTYPPIFYLNDTSKRIIQLIHAYNDHCGEIRAAYTFDAGPNAVIYTLDRYLPEVFAFITHFFPSELLRKSEDFSPPTESTSLAHLASFHPDSGALKYILQTKAGPGAMRNDTKHLIDENGKPVGSS